MIRVLLGRSVVGGGCSAPSTTAFRCFHPSLMSCERRRASPTKKRQRKKSKVKRKHRTKDHEDGKQEGTAHGDSSSESIEAFESLASERTIPLEVRSKSKADSTFLHGLEGLALQWSPPSVRTSEHPTVNSVLQDIQSRDKAEFLKEVDQVEATR